MAKDSKRIYMPMGAGGLLRFPEEEKEAIKLKPKHVIWIVVGIVILEIFLKLFVG